MSWLDNWEAIKGLRLAADASAQQAHDSAKQVVETLRAGVDISLAHRIITEHWGTTSQASRIRTRLSGMFPEENGSVLLCTPLLQDDLDKFRGEYGDVVAYFEGIHQYVLGSVGMITAKYNCADPNDYAMANLYNEFRANAMRYTCYVDDMFYSVRDILQKEEVDSWAKLIELAPVESLYNGDYLFMDEFVTKLSKVQRHYVGEELKVEERDSFAVSDIEWLLYRAISHIKVPYLFAEYLNTLMEDA